MDHRDLCPWLNSETLKNRSVTCLKPAWDLFSEIFEQRGPFSKLSEKSQFLFFSEKMMSLELLDMHLVIFDGFSQYLRLG